MNKEDLKGTLFGIGFALLLISAAILMSFGVNCGFWVASNVNNGLSPLNFSFLGNYVFWIYVGLGSIIMFFLLLRCVVIID